VCGTRGGFPGPGGPADSSAQAIINIGGGLTLPTGEYNDYAKPGWLGHAGVAFPVGDAGLSVGAHGYYGSNSHGIDGDKTNLYGALGALGISFGDPEGVAPQVFGLVGSMTHQYKSESFPTLDGSQTGLGAGVGFGIGFPLGGIGASVGGFFLTGFGDLDGTHIFGNRTRTGDPNLGNSDAEGAPSGGFRLVEPFHSSSPPRRGPETAAFRRLAGHIRDTAARSLAAGGGRGQRSGRITPLVRRISS